MGFWEGYGSGTATATPKSSGFWNGYAPTKVTPAPVVAPKVIPPQPTFKFPSLPSTPLGLQKDISSKAATLPITKISQPKLPMPVSVATNLVHTLLPTANVVQNPKTAKLTSVGEGLGTLATKALLAPFTPAPVGAPTKSQATSPQFKQATKQPGAIEQGVNAITGRLFLGEGGAAVQAARGVAGIVFGGQYLKNLPQTIQAIKTESDPSKRLSMVVETLGGAALVGAGALHLAGTIKGLPTEKTVPGERISVPNEQAREFFNNPNPNIDKPTADLLTKALKDNKQQFVGELRSGKNISAQTDVTVPTVYGKIISAIQGKLSRGEDLTPAESTVVDDVTKNPEIYVPKSMSQADLIQSHYTPGQNTPEESGAYQHIISNPERALNKYDELIQKEFGASNVVSGDVAKYVIPGMNSESSVNFHEPASALAKAKYDQLLADPSTKDKPVLIMAGGSGAGKTATLRANGKNLGDYAAVVDTNLNSVKSAVDKIRAARQSGRTVEVSYVYRDPIESFKSVISRGTKEDRVVPISGHIENHLGSRETIPQLQQEFATDQGVHFDVLANLGQSSAEAQVTTIDKLPQIVYNRSELQNTLKGLADEARQNNTITPEAHATYLGSAEAQPELTSSSPQVREVPQQNAQIKTGSRPGSLERKSTTGTPKLAQGVKSKALKNKIIYGFDKTFDLPEYEKVDVKEQAEKATELVLNYPEKAFNIAMGKEPPPQGILPESVFVAMENYAIETKNVEVLRQLATQSELTSEATKMGQRIRILAERDPNSVVGAIKSIGDARLKAAEKKNKNIKADVKKTVKEIKASVPKVKKEDWQSFISELEC